MKKRYCILVFFILLTATACQETTETTSPTPQNTEREDMLTVMQAHLDAVAQRDLTTLKNTLAPDGTMQLILPQTEIIYGVDGFMDYHREWFKDSTWTFETKILNSEVSDNLGMAITEIIYREPERDGVPYFNRMIVSYDLRKMKDNWYVIKDHASSVEKSTDR
ncbi:MAG: hypothetical protein CMC35_07825 [Flavobacteriaceae bacterium]|nr:hypothetical protein [Flavobacteriaceae bacterium]|tara:strand:+ start:1017 stop:1508 length:492 start_codon:yes stop_codon:yes gene_type:complete